MQRKHDMPRKPPQTYDVVRAADGALVVRDATLEIARSEAARLNAEARVINPETRMPTGMYLGEVTTYEARAQSGLVVPSGGGK